MKYFLLAVIASAVLAISPATAQNRQLAFTPHSRTTIGITATTSSTSGTFPASTLGDLDIEIANSGTSTVHCVWGQGAQTAIVPVPPSIIGDIPIFAGTKEVFAKGNQTDTIACISTSGTNTVFVTPGNGQ